MNDTLSTVQTVAARILETDLSATGSDTPLADVPGWDSLKHLDLVMELEKEFKCSFTLEELVGIRRLGDIAEILLNRGADT